MGELIIEVPQNVKRFYRVKDSKFSEQLLHDLEKNSSSVETPAVLSPRRNNLKEDLADVFGIWSDREESAEEIARKIRNRNNGKDG